MDETMTKDQQIMRLMELRKALESRLEDKVLAEARLSRARDELDKAMHYMVYHNTTDSDTK